MISPPCGWRMWFTFAPKQTRNLLVCYLQGSEPVALGGRRAGGGAGQRDHCGATFALSALEWPALGSASRRRPLFVLFFLNYFL